MVDSPKPPTDIPNAFRIEPDESKQKIAAPKRQLKNDTITPESNPKSSGNRQNILADQFFMRAPRSKFDMYNVRFGNLVALYPSGRGRHGKLIVLCQCDCGKRIDVLLERLRDGRTRSCGCLRNTILANAQPKPEPKRSPPNPFAMSLTDAVRKALKSNSLFVDLQTAIHGPTAERSEGYHIQNPNTQSNLDNITHQDASDTNSDSSEPHPALPSLATDARSLSQQIVDQQVEAYEASEAAIEIESEELDYDSWLADLKKIKPD